MYRKIFSLLTAMVCIASISNAQTTVKDKPRFGHDIPSFSLGIGLGLGSYNFDNINHQLAVHGCPQLQNNMLAMNFNFVIAHAGEPLFVDVSGGGSTYTTTTNNISLHQTVATSEVSLNYFIVNRGRNRFYAGLGFGQMIADAAFTTNEDGQTFLSSTVLFQGERPYRLQTAYYIDPRIGYDFQLDKRGFFYLGAKAAYRIGLNNKDWGLQFNALSAAPKTNASGFNLSANITLKLS
ncbi:MAG: hypothetical protein H0X33_13820 [Taibaiella sp.]|nr:hypothetical protein [Taibaiella sp.]